jgi:cytoskeletal protein CcmA (bactofilin family)
MRTAKKKVEITRTGKVFGNIRAPIIAVAEGAIFRGASQMAVDSEATPAKQEGRHGEPSQKPKAVSGEAPRLDGVRKD